jgi:CrcB protein
VSVGQRAGVVAAVAIGGALGTVARYEIALAEPVQSGRFPWATFTANLVGCVVLGIAVVVFAESRARVGVPRAFLAVGFCGGLTTFSTWMVESVLLTRDGEAGVAALYLVVSLVLGLLAVVVGVAASRRVLGQAVPEFDPELDD